MAGLLTKLQDYIQHFKFDDIQIFCQNNIQTILIGGVTVVVLWLLTRKPRGIPSGPRFTLPIVGDLLSINDRSDDGDIRLPFRRLRQQYGDIYSVYMGSKLFIVMSGYEFIKDTLVKNGDVFSDRPSLFITDAINRKKGLVFTSGRQWQEQRKFAIETLREFGVGRSMMEDKIQVEIEVFIAEIRKQKGEPFDICRLVQAAVSNVICSLVFGERFEYTNPVFRQFLHKSEEMFESAGSTTAINFLPILRFLPGDLFKFKKTLRNARDIEETLLKPSIKDHIKNFDENNTNDYISCFIKEMKKEEKNGKTTISMDMDNMIRSISDLFIAGTETTSTTILWTILYFLHYPAVYEKCYKEIQDVVGSGRRPSMKDKQYMPYNEAVSMEVLRIANILIIGLPYAANRDVVYQGYHIPKDAIIIPNLDSVLGSNEVWGDADVFRPERFIDANGKIMKPEEWIPFSIGRRVCLGEALAKMELFLFLTTLVQRFDFKAVDVNNLPSLKGTFGITHAPVKYEVKAIPR